MFRAVYYRYFCNYLLSDKRALPSFTQSIVLYKKLCEPLMLFRKVRISFLKLSSVQNLIYLQTKDRIVL